MARPGTREDAGAATLAQPQLQQDLQPGHSSHRMEAKLGKEEDGPPGVV